jgi:single-strand DNA-binding protein
MNEVVLEGPVSGEPRQVPLPSGDVAVTWSVRAAGPGGRQQAVPVVWIGSPGRSPRLTEGEVVLVAGALQRRFFRGAGGLQSRTEVVARTVVRRPSAARRQRVMADVVERLV